MAGFAENCGMFPYMVDSVRKTLFSSAPVGRIDPNDQGWTVELLDWANPENQIKKRKLTPSTGWTFLQGKGIRRGRLIGGCIEVIDWLRGTRFWPSPEMWQGAILFLETSEEAPLPAEVLRYLRTYAAMGILENLSGILIGRPGGQVPPAEFDDYDQAVSQVILEEENLVDLPVITRMDFGHTHPMFVLPYGIEAEINCETHQFAIVEKAVVD
jgi:muramoyltetrapeptide carboxypeptidase LdcA involved in peptidoglycan recycling